MRAFPNIFEYGQKILYSNNKTVQMLEVLKAEFTTPHFKFIMSLNDKQTWCKVRIKLFFSLIKRAVIYFASLALIVFKLGSYTT
jgi:hypothetical protein